MVIAKESKENVWNFYNFRSKTSTKYMQNQMALKFFLNRERFEDLNRDG